ncbi:MAG: protein kinase family protein [Prevotella sp.]|nr:protein kinase family protein [Prevotella sp.]
MNYPLISEYVEAIKAAEDNFKELTNLRPVLGDDWITSGNYAVVFKMEDVETGKFYALKCFTKEQEGRAEAYHQIANALKDVDSPYLVSLRYLDKELFVDTEQKTETEFPVLLMDWVEGKTLDKYLRENLDDKYALEMLAYRFSQLAQWLIPQPFAHGDLKPDNILVRGDGTLVLVDYDGMYVPDMKGQKARELGSPDFRHPLRTEVDFDEHIDDFPITLILLSLKAISFNPDYLDEYGAVDRLLISSKELHDLKECNFLKDVIPSGNSIIDRYAFLFCTVYYEKSLSSQLYNYIPTSKPLPLIPYTIGKHKYSLYDTENQVILPLQFKYIELIDPTFTISSSCIISNEYWGHTNAAIISRSNDLNNIQWYKQVLGIGKLKTRFIAQDTTNRYGIINDMNIVLLDFDFQEIKTIEVEDEVYLICKKGNYYGVLNKDLKVIVPYVLTDLHEYSYLKLIVYKKEQYSTYAMDMNTLRECRIPSNYNRIDDYKDGIITFELSDNQYRFYSLDNNSYINSYTYQKTSKYAKLVINESFVLCKRNGASILLSIDGTEYPIDFEGALSQYGETVIGVSPIEIKYIGQYGFEETRYNYKVYVFKKNILSTQFVYKDGYGCHETFELINDNTIWVWHYGKWSRTGGCVNLNGEHVPWPNSNNGLSENSVPNENMHLINIVKEKYLNSTYISNYDKLEIDQCCFFEIKDLGGIAFVSYHWENGSCDYEDHLEENIRLGYADENMCYWSIDCMNNQI